MLGVYIALAIVLFIILVLFIIAIIFHHLSFGHRFIKDPLVSYYKVKEFNMSREAIEIKCGKNRLRGYSYNNDNRTRDELVIFAHGMWSNIDAYNQEICTIALAGYEVIAINYTGVDSSDGKTLLGLGGSLMALDALLNYIKLRPEYDNRKIYVVGHSWGAFAASNIVKYHSDIKKVVAISPFISPARLLMGLLPRAMYGIIPFIILVDYFKCHKYSISNTLKSIKGYTGEMLILHSKNDPIVKFDLNTGYLMKRSSNIEYLINDDKLHNPTYTNEALECMNEYLAKCKLLKGSELDTLKRNTDFHKMGELDSRVMDKIIEFLNKNEEVIG